MNRRPRIIPCLLINDGYLVKTKKFKDPVYLGDPINTVRIFNEEEADEICLLDISSHRNKRIDFELLADIASEAFMPLAYGGGISTLDEARELYRIGFEKLVFNTALVTDRQLIRDVVQYAGAQSVVASVDVKRNLFGKRNCYVDCGKTRVDQDLRSYIHAVESLGVGEILLNSIDNDGMMEGYDIGLIKEISDNTKVPLIACGGAGSVGDLKRAIEEGGAHAAAAGSLFVFFGPRRAVLINYPKEKELDEAGLL